MLTSTRKLHFKTEDAYNGLAAVQGILRLEKQTIILEYQVKDNIIGMIKSKPKDLRIPYEELEEVSYKVNWFVSNFRLHVSSMRILGEFPAGKDGVIKLRINRKQKESAKQLASHINLTLSEYRLKMMGDDEEFL
ncbi:MAG: hypothetical protein AAF587_40345 [Bacteroidota bacterium]